jgi:hypothetical protein
MNFKHESDGKCHRKILSSGDEGFENLWAKAHKIVTTATVHDKGSCISKEHDQTKLVNGVR